jgi:hypothetical protein
MIGGCSSVEVVDSLGLSLSTTAPVQTYSKIPGLEEFCFHGAAFTWYRTGSLLNLGAALADEFLLRPIGRSITTPSRINHSMHHNVVGGRRRRKFA